MNLNQYMDLGDIKKVPPDRIKSQSLRTSSKEAIETAARIPQEPTTRKSIIRELYEGLRQMIEAIGFSRGYKFSNHECMTPFVTEIIKDERIASRFDRYRKIRNWINYYGDDVSLETVQEALNEIPRLASELEKHLRP